jgi:ATP-dependent protease HslVU (ClpYQ) peptidase subunit
MTTIVATREAIGADTLVVVAGQAPYPTKKVSKHKKMLFGAAGDAGDCVRFMKWAKRDFDMESRPRFRCEADSDDEAIMLMVNEGGIYVMMTSDLFPEPVDADFYAIGSGAGAALGAMARGATIEEALNIAAQYDNCTRGPFTILTLK